ncbi:hypothetical protein [Fodinicola feengrottensis]|uniref:hypothetical protein n=1 Tax=Fodinicola feengrottensis TaxID=435914 RepID=UPI0013D7984F|nr:hypothetical protein [Fodinicola feengrottensis]
MVARRSLPPSEPSQPDQDPSPLRYFWYSTPSPPTAKTRTCPEGLVAAEIACSCEPPSEGSQVLQDPSGCWALW